MAQLSVFTLSIPNIKIFIYIESSVAGFTMPPLEIVLFLIVHPVSVYVKLFSRVQGYFAVVIGVIFKLAQDCIFLA